MIVIVVQARSLLYYVQMSDIVAVVAQYIPIQTHFDYIASLPVDKALFAKIDYLQQYFEVHDEYSFVTAHNMPDLFRKCYPACNKDRLSFAYHIVVMINLLALF